MTIAVDEIYQKLKNIRIGGSVCRYPYELCEKLTPLINEINKLKREKNAIILAHSYVAPEIIYGVADFVGDSYKLSWESAQTKANVIIFSAVKFMAETAKILSPKKQVLVPSSFNGCSLADSITAEDVRRLKQFYPNHTFVCYINTTADVKAQCHTCVTSSNVYDIIEMIPNNKIYFLPDELMGRNILEEMKKRGIKKEILFYHGTCYVHEQYEAEMIDYIRLEYPEVKILSHPECDTDITKKSDYVGSTGQMLNYVHQSSSESFFLLTECGLTERLESEIKNKKFVGTCTMCRYMKSNTLEDIKRVLIAPKERDEIKLSEGVIQKAKQSIQQMFSYVETKKKLSL